MTVSGDGKFSPVLAAEVPTKDNGGLGADGKTVTYKLKQGVKWADGEPFTADDVVFTYQFISNQETAATTLGTYADLASRRGGRSDDRAAHLQGADRRLVRAVRRRARAGPAEARPGAVHRRGFARRAVQPEADRHRPVHGRGLQAGRRRSRWSPTRTTATRTSRSSARSTSRAAAMRRPAARAVLQTGEYDYAWNLQVEAQVLNQLMQGGKGELVTGAGRRRRAIILQSGRSRTPRSTANAPVRRSKHPFLTDIEGAPGDGDGDRPRDDGQAAVRPDRRCHRQRPDHARRTWRPKNTTLEFNIDKANQILDEAGYTRGSTASA